MFYVFKLYGLMFSNPSSSLISLLLWIHWFDGIHIGVDPDELASKAR